MINEVVLIILDGFGIAPPGPGNAIYLANPTNIKNFLSSFPNTVLKASGEAVGLPSSEVGNTEVGHLNIGAGKIVYQDLPRINMSIADGTFFKNETLLKAVDHVKKNNSQLHLIGLTSEGVVHSSLDHLWALLYFAKEANLSSVYIHAITDGRDSPPKSALNIIKLIQEKTKQLGVGAIASVMGRYYAMDRDHRWDRTAKAYFCLTQNQTNKANDPLKVLEESYKQGVTDEFIHPTNILVNNHIPLVSKNDVIIFFNYRIDRVRQLSKAFALDNFETDANKDISFDPYAVKYFHTHQPQEVILSPPFHRGKKIENLLVITLTEYEKIIPASVAFKPLVVEYPIGRVLAENQLLQLRLSESEKERFVTFYFNGQRESPFPFEERSIIPSPKVPTYDLKPEMSAYQLTDTLIEKIRTHRYKFIVVNYANPDMVGHTGNIQATIEAIKVIDQCLGKIVLEVLNQNIFLLITADHGNAEEKINPQTGQISTEHTGNPVPFIAIANQFQGRFTRLQPGILADIAPTVLAIMGIKKPETMTGRNLLEEMGSISP